MPCDPMEQLDAELRASSQRAEAARARIETAAADIGDAVTNEDWSGFHDAAVEFAEATTEFWATVENPEADLSPED